MTRICVENLPTETATVRSICSIFGDMGPIMNASVTMDDDPSTSHALINYRTAESARRAVEEFNCARWNGVIIRVRMADDETNRIVKEGLETGKGCLFIKNLDQDIDDSQILNAFSDYGKVISCQVLTDEHNKSRGYAYVQFRNHDDAIRVIRNFKMASINGRPAIVSLYRGKIGRKHVELHTNLTKKNFPKSISINR